MADRIEASGVLHLRAPIRTDESDGRSSEIYCDRWSFQTAEGLAIAQWQPRGPVMQAWFAVAYSAPVSDPEDPGTVTSTILVLIPGENVLGFSACNKAPPLTVRVGPEAPPA